ncbi:MAG: TIGR00730 family Rossman fold protein [Chloroflexota bacterium]|nr:MAG: TIGR00730 family Rossman fold protein [Chloroflexota bacterium]
MRVCVYCASSDWIDEVYFAAARALGEGMARRGWPLVYGGGSVGLMGELARTIHAAGGTVIGVIPRALLDYEVGYRDADELIVTATMRERKQVMDDRADAFVTLPGGFGTLEELLEIVTLKQLGYHNKPIVIVNMRGYFDPLLEQFERIYAQRFTHDRVRGLYAVVDTAEAALELLSALEIA